MAMTSNTKASPLDFGTAALAACSAGFLAFAMPEAAFTGLVEASRLPEFVAAAQPPLGDTARMGATAAAAVLVFLLVYLLMRALDRVPARASAADHGEPVLRLRAADVHPDAPARRPLLAGRELGEPVEPVEEEVAAEAPPVLDEPEAPSLLDSVSILDESDSVEERPADLDPQPLPGFLTVTQPEEPVAETVAEIAPEPEPETLELQPEAELQPQQQEPVEALAPDPGVAQEEQREESVTELMQRLESGLGRRQKPQALNRDEAALTPPAEPEDRVGHRLRSAINDLQKMAARGA